MLYPRSKCIQIIRDGRDVALSTLATSWGAKTVRDAARRWKELILAGRKTLDRSRMSYVEIRYEELVRFPEEQLKRAIDFLELKADSIEVPITFPVSQNSVGIWRSKLTKDDREIFAREAGDLLIELGYETDYRWVFE